MGGRGSSSGKANEAQLVPYEKWGKDVVNKPIYGTLPDGTRGIIGEINDETLYEYKQTITPITKEEIIKEIKDINISDEDVLIVTTYENGDTWDNKSGKRFKTRGIIGASISTPDGQSVWGEDWIGSGENMRRVPMKSSEEDDGLVYTNSRIGYDVVGSYKQRVKTTYGHKDRYNGKKREVIRKSSIKKW